jgi:hypothetical protein
LIKLSLLFEFHGHPIQPQRRLGPDSRDRLRIGEHLRGCCPGNHADDPNEEPEAGVTGIGTGNIPRGSTVVNQSGGTDGSGDEEAADGDRGDG